MKTKQEIQTEIEALKVTRKELNDYDWNLIIDAQLDVLLNHLNREQILDKYGQRSVDKVILYLALYVHDWVSGQARKNLLATIEAVTQYRAFKDDDFNTDIKGMPDEE